MMRSLVVALILCLIAAPAAAARIKDIATLRDASDSQLVGYGLVVGLSGTGDTFRNTPFTQQAVQGMLQNLGMDVHGIELRNRNVAAVIVTTDLPAGVQTGSRLDVTVSALGDAPSLMGGTLLLTQLQGSDSVVHATAQGAVSVTGFASQGQGETLSQGVPTAGRIPNGAIVQQEIPGAPDQLRSMLALKNPDYATAVRIVDAINIYSLARFHARAAYEVDSRTVEIFRPRNVSLARFMAVVGELQVQPDMAARVVLDARTGTVVVGQDVQISTVAVTYGTLTVRVNEQPQVSQPNPFAQGRTVVTPNTTINAEQTGGPIVHRRRLEPAHAGRRPQPDRRQAAGHHRHPAGDQDAPARFRPISSSSRAQAQRKALSRRCPPIRGRCMSITSRGKRSGPETARDGARRTASLPFSPRPSSLPPLRRRTVGPRRRKSRRRRPIRPARKNWPTPTPAGSALRSPRRLRKRASPGRPSVLPSSTPRSSSGSLISKRRKPRRANGSPSARRSSRPPTTTSSPSTPECSRRTRPGS